MSMRVTHQWKRRRLTGNGDTFLIGNGKSFLSLGSITKYNGLVVLKDNPEKTLHDLVLPGHAVKQIRNKVNRVERFYKDNTRDSFELTEKGLVYELKGYNGPLYIDMDSRRVDDLDPMGRIFSHELVDGTLHVHYEKQGNYTIDMDISGVRDFTPIGSWQPRSYAYDQRRNDKDAPWVFRLGSINVEQEVTLLFHVPGGFPNIDEKDPHKGIAITSLHMLSNNGTLAGYPWFTQRWSRDELVCLGAWIHAGNVEHVHNVLMEYVNRLSEGPLDAYFPRGGLHAADASGWLAKRVMDAMHAYPEIFSEAEKGRILAVFEKAMAQVPMKNGLIVNGPGETWMDAPVEGDDRAGACIEIQALHLATLECCALLGASKYRHQAKAFAARVRDAFFHEGMLADRITSIPEFTGRPNVFIAYYVAPHLLKFGQWRSVFEHALKQLWLLWGGIASIDKKHPLFEPYYTGMNNRSYHRGDSWYWVNALAAICLHNFDPQKYNKKVKKITQACIKDMLQQGAFGHCSEVSSAKRQEWGGCFAQTWSAAMLYELLDQVGSSIQLKR